MSFYLKLLISSFFPLFLLALYFFFCHFSLACSSFCVLSELVESSSVLSSFTGDFLAGALLLLIGSFLVPFLLDRRKAPLLVLRERVSKSTTLVLSKAVDGNWEGSFHLAIKNLGQTTQTHWYWRLLVPNELQPHLVTDGITVPNEEVLAYGEMKWKSFYGDSTSPIYSLRSYHFPYTLKVKADTQKKVHQSIFYYFSTEFGTSPSKAKDIEDALNKGEVSKIFTPEYMGRLTISSPEV